MFSAHALAAQAPASQHGKRNQSAEEIRYVLRVTTREVLVGLIALDRHNQPVLDLKPDGLHISEVVETEPRKHSEEKPHDIGIEMVVPDERLNHHLCRFIEMVFGNGCDDLMAFATPTKRKLRQVKSNKKEGGEESLHAISRTVVQSCAMVAKGPTSPPCGPLLVGHKVVGSAKEDLAWPVLREFAAEGARDGDGLKRKFLMSRRGGISFANAKNLGKWKERAVDAQNA